MRAREVHTWTRELVFHPHVHAIVSAGAWSPGGTWLPSRTDYLFPVKVMARLFRRLFREQLLRAIDTGDVDVSAELVEPMRRAVFEKNWVVYAKAPFGGAEQVYSYLGRYTHRVGIANSRILRADEHGVTFSTKNGRTRTLEPVEFLRRFLLHVLPKRFHKIGHYGLCSNHHIAAETLDRVREQLAASSEPPAAATAPRDPPSGELQSGGAPETWIECLLALMGVDALRCPRCQHGRLLRLPLDAERGSAHGKDTS